MARGTLLGLLALLWVFLAVRDATRGDEFGMALHIALAVLNGALAVQQLLHRRAAREAREDTTPSNGP